MAELDAEARSIFLCAGGSSAGRMAGDLDESCADRPEVRAKVERLLADHVLLGTNSRRREAPTGPATRSADRARRRAPSSPGPTSCWSRSAKAASASSIMAEQQQPVRRKVALKVIKPGMDTRQVIARFEAERQALALMDHPNIAKVFDGGATDTGRPYFVMELVKGVPITEYCDQNQLDAARSGWSCSSTSARPCSTPIRRGSSTATSSRPTCCVTCTTTTPVAKVIDFGVAKATGPAADRQDAVHRLRPDDRHAAVHEPRAGGA